MELPKDNWKEVMNERFTGIKKQIEEIRSIYNKKMIKRGIKRKVNKDDNAIESNEDFIDDTTHKVDQAETDIFMSSCQEIENLEKIFSNENQNTMVSEEIFSLYGHLLIRTLDKMKMYLTDHDINTKEFSEKFANIKNVFIKRQKQFQRLLSVNAPTDYDNNMLEYETILQQRINELKLSQSNEKSFIELKVNYLNTFHLYIRQCVNFHSTINITGIYGNLDEFFKYFFEEKINLNENQRHMIELSFTHFNIPLVNPQILCRKKLEFKQNQSENFFPSQHIDETIDKEKEIDVDFIDLIKSIRNDRWTVLLGSAGSGKTTFARWLICQFARALFIEENNIIIEDIHMGPVRIPILIRIGEFAEWLENHPTSNLFDYIGHQTWFGQAYVNDGFEILQDFVRYGHALIILDGLDEIATTVLYNQILSLVRIFIQSYCMSHEFISPFDDTSMEKEELEFGFRREGLFGGNLILITSRILNYSIHPLSGELITHYTIQPMNIEYLCSFIKNWCLHVQDEIVHVFKRYVPDFTENKMKLLSNLKAKNLITRIEMNEGLRSLASNPSVLSIICTLFVQNGVETFEKTRVQLYKKVVELMMQRWQYQQLNIPKDALISTFSNVASYIHSHSQSGLIDEFDLNRLCYLSLQQWYKKNSNSRTSISSIRQQTIQFIQLLNEDAGIVSARSLAVFSFLHLTFQEYFVCYNLINIDKFDIKKDIKELIDQFLSLFLKPRLREPLNLVMGWISSHWTSEDYDKFCTELQSKSYLINKYIPVGSLWFASALNDLACLPSLSIVYDMLDALLVAYTVDIKNGWTFRMELKTAFDRLPVTIVNSWFDYLFSKEDSIYTWEMIRLIFSEVDRCKTLPNWITPIICEILWKELGRFDEEVDIYIDQILMIIGVMNYDRLPTRPGSLREYLLTRSIRTAEIHSSVLTAIIALYGGLERNYSKTKNQTSVTFSARYMHRDSPLSSLFIEYMEDKMTERTIKLKHFSDQCQKLLITTASTNLNLQKTHSLIVLFCFYGIDQSSNYEHYVDSEVWQEAIQHMNMVLLYLRQFFPVNPISKFKNNLTDIFEYFMKDLKENILNFAQSASHAYCRLIRTESSWLLPGFYMKSQIHFGFAVKMPKKMDLPNVTHLNEDELIRLLPFICCVSPVSCPDLNIEEYEAKDLKFLKEGKHPFQLLQNKPIILLLAYIPVSLQSLYIQLIARNQISSDDPSCLPFLHLLIEFLRVLSRMITYSIRYWVLFTVLSPIFVENGMENFILPFINTDIFKNNSKYFSDVFKDSSFQFFASKIRIGTYKEEKNAQESARIEEQNRIINAQTDLQLYAAICCSASLTIISYSFHDNRALIETKFHQLWDETEKIKQPLWRLDAMITICCILFSKDKDEEINNQRQDRYLSLLACLQEFESKIQLVTYVALFVRCMTFIHKDFQIKKNMLYNILQRLTTVTIPEQQAICEALGVFPNFQTDIVQHVRQLQSLENIVKLNQIFDRKSLTFSKYFSEKYFSTSDIKGTRSTLLVCMQLSEIYLYVKFLDNSLTKEIHDHPIDNRNSPLMNQTCLEALTEEPIKSLSFEAASMISNLLCSHFVGLENIAIIRIKQALTQKTMIDESAISVVLEWLSYRYDKQFCSFAYHGALLLGLTNIWTPTILEICCELVLNDDDYFRFSAMELIEDGKWHSVKQSNHTIINYIDQWNKKGSKWCSDVEFLFTTLDIKIIDEIKQILQLERNRFEKSMINRSKIHEKIDDDSYYEVSFFRLIKTLSSEVIEYMIIIFKSLLNYLAGFNDFLFVCWIFEHIPNQLLENNDNFIDFFIEIITGSYPNKLKILAVRKLYCFRKNEQVENVLWDMIINNKQKNSDDIIAECIWSLFINQSINDDSIQKRLKILDHLRKHTSSPFIRKQVLSVMYLQIITEPERYHIIDVYHSYMANARFIENISSWSKVTGGGRTSVWILKYASILLPQFINDMYESFDNISSLHASDYLTVAQMICKEISNEFLVAIRQSSIGEDAFRKRLYKMIQRATISELTNYLYIYACLEQISPNYVSMFLKVGASCDSSDRESLRIVTERQSVELLINTLQSSLSLAQRYAAAELLVDLVVMDQVSLFEVQNLLTIAIDEVQSQQIVIQKYLLKEYDQKLRNLLIRLMIKAPDQTNYESTISMTNENQSIPIPAALFQTNNFI